MTEDMLKRVWLGESADAAPMTLEALHGRERRFDRQVRRRNLIEYLASAVVVLTFGAYIALMPIPAGKIGAGLLIAAVLFVVWQLHRRASASSAPDRGQSLIDHYRGDLARQRDALRSVPLWYLAPFLPGFAAFLLDPRMIAASGTGGIVRTAAIIALVFATIWALNVWVARRLDARIAELDAMRQGD